MNPSSVEILTAVHDWRQGELRNNAAFNVNAERVLTVTALMHDAVRLFSAAVREFSTENELEVKKFKCARLKQWEQGAELLKMVDEVSSLRQHGRQSLIGLRFRTKRKA